jgi:hypothetical protein
VGAVFNRDFPGNRGLRPLPPNINFYLNDLEFYVVSYEVIAMLNKARPLKKLGAIVAEPLSAFHTIFN